MLREVQLDGRSIRVFVNLDAAPPRPFLAFLRKAAKMAATGLKLLTLTSDCIVFVEQVCSVALVAVFAVWRRQRCDEPRARRAALRHAEALKQMCRT